MFRNRRLARLTAACMEQVTSPGDVFVSSLGHEFHADGLYANAFRCRCGRMVGGADSAAVAALMARHLLDAR